MLVQVGTVDLGFGKEVRIRIERGLSSVDIFCSRAEVMKYTCTCIVEGYLRLGNTDHLVFYGCIEAKQLEVSPDELIRVQEAKVREEVTA